MVHLRLSQPQEPVQQLRMWIQRRRRRLQEVRRLGERSPPRATVRKPTLGGPTGSRATVRKPTLAVISSPPMRSSTPGDLFLPLLRSKAIPNRRATEAAQVHVKSDVELSDLLLHPQQNTRLFCNGPISIVSFFAANNLIQFHVFCTSPSDSEPLFVHLRTKPMNRNPISSKLPSRRSSQMTTVWKKHQDPEQQHHQNHHKGGGVWVGNWDYSNAYDFIKYTVSKRYQIDSWEFGNELSGSGVEASVGAGQYGRDLIKLKSIINHLYNKSVAKPALMAPGGFFDQSWFARLLQVSGSGTVDIISQHLYNLGAGVDPMLNGHWASIWVGESGGAYNSGGRNVSDTYVNSFWYLDQLGMSAKYNTRVYCRQSLVRGNYGFLNRTSFVPNPDYYSALL
ncbi:hypothetical protein ACFX13_038857 [Malus domestica]